MCSEWREVEELFQRTGEVWEVEVEGRLIRTTGEHPFYGRCGWTQLRDLAPGQAVLDRAGVNRPITRLCNTQAYEPVYNIRVAQAHTYFVGAQGWHFYLWVHNAYEEFRNKLAEELWLDPNGPEFQSGGVYHEAYQTAHTAHLEGKIHASDIRENFNRQLPSELSEGVRNELWNETVPNADMIKAAEVLRMFEGDHLSTRAIRDAMEDPDLFAKSNLSEPADGWVYHGKTPAKVNNLGELPGGTVKWMERWIDGNGNKVSVHYHLPPADSFLFGIPQYIKVKLTWTTNG